jgi:hypothetical protein
MADDADDQTSDWFLEVYLLWLFGWVLFCESVGESVSRCMIPWAQRTADAPLEQMPQISWGQRCSGSYLQGAVFGSDEVDEYGGDPPGVPSPAPDVDPRAVRHRSAQDGPLGVRGGD